MRSCIIVILALLLAPSAFAERPAVVPSADPAQAVYSMRLKKAESVAEKVREAYLLTVHATNDTNHPDAIDAETAVLASEGCLNQLKLVADDGAKQQKLLNHLERTLLSAMHALHRAQAK